VFATQDPIKQQLVRARRNQILDAASKVFAEKGFHRATTKEIASEAGVAEGTIYNYFDSKGDLLMGIMMRLSRVESIGVELAEALDKDARTFLLAIAQHRMAMIEQKHETLRAVLPEMLVNPDLREQFYQRFTQPLAKLLEQYVQARIESGDIRRVDVPLTVRTVQGMFIGLLIMRFFGDDVLMSHWDDLPEAVVDVLFGGLTPKKAV
jgi:AcrR family transcriptional regulator